MLYDKEDPTTALFVSMGAASKAARMVEKAFPKRVLFAEAFPRIRRGELLGYHVKIAFRDNRPRSYLTNSDFERLSSTNPKERTLCPTA